MPLAEPVHVEGVLIVVEALLDCVPGVVLPKGFGGGGDGGVVREVADVPLVAVPVLPDRVYVKVGPAVAGVN